MSNNIFGDDQQIVDAYDVHADAERLERVLDEAYRAVAAETYFDADEYGNPFRVEPEIETAAAVAAQEKFEEHMHSHRSELSSDPRWQPYYDEIDRAAEAHAGPGAALSAADIVGAAFPADPGSASLADIAADTVRSGPPQAREPDTGPTL